MITRTATHALSPQRTARLVTVATLIGLGLGLVFVAGFASPQAIHDAAHDSRHALSFPCH
jgi:cobalt transporter subunit CbtB